MFDGRHSAKKLSLLIDSPSHKTAHWQDLASFVRREKIPGVELRSVPWKYQQDLLRLLFPGRVKPESTVAAEKAAAKAKAASASRHKRGDASSIRAMLQAKTSVVLKRELLAREMKQSGTKPVLVERLCTEFLEEDRNGGYRWWSKLEVDLNDFFQRVNVSNISEVRQCRPSFG